MPYTRLSETRPWPQPGEQPGPIPTLRVELKLRPSTVAHPGLLGWYVDDPGLRPPGNGSSEGR